MRQLQTDGGARWTDGVFVTSASALSLSNGFFVSTSETHRHKVAL